MEGLLIITLTTIGAGVQFLQLGDDTCLMVWETQKVVTEPEPNQKIEYPWWGLFTPLPRTFRTFNLSMISLLPSITVGSRQAGRQARSVRGLKSGDYEVEVEEIEEIEADWL